MHNICVMFLFNIVHVHFPSRKLQVIIFYNKNVKSLQTSPYINFAEAFSIAKKYYFDIYFLFGFCAILDYCWRVEFFSNHFSEWLSLNNTNLLLFVLNYPVRHKGSNTKDKKIREKKNCFHNKICFLRTATNKNEAMKFVDRKLNCL